VQRVVRRRLVGDDVRRAQLPSWPIERAAPAAVDSTIQARASSTSSVIASQ
jgi:hypothetical protein